LNTPASSSAVNKKKDYNYWIFADLMANRAGYPSLDLNKFRMENYPDYIRALNLGDEKDYSAMALLKIASKDGLLTGLVFIIQK